MRRISALAWTAAASLAVKVLGLQGLLLGPALMALAFAVLQLYAAETRARRHLDA